MADFGFKYQPPSGEQIELRHGDQRVVVVEGGAGLRSYEAGGVAVLDGYDADEMVSSGRGQLLLPWPNRLHGGRYSWDGHEHVVPVDNPEEGVALHGLTRWRSWRVETRQDSAVTLALRLLPQPGYPFALDLSVDYALDDGGLAVTTSAQNVGSAAAPYGQGAHPYLTVGTTFVDAALLQLPARTLLTTDDDSVPVGRADVEGTALEFRSARRIGDAVLDHTLTDLDRGPDGRAETVLRNADSGRQVVLWQDEGYRYLQVFSGDTVWPERRRQGLAIEPMTCPPDAFRSGQDVLRLEPGEGATHRWGIRAS